MFRISLKYKFVFFRIPKTASTSISTVLSPFEDKNLRFVLNHKLESKLASLNLSGPDHINQVILKPILDEINVSITEDFFEFVFVRHPYTRLASMYNRMKKRKPTIAKVTDEYLDNDQFTLPDFTMDELIDRCEERVENYNNEKGQMICNSQLNWINCPLTNKVHFFKLEELSESWVKIRETLNLDLPDVPILNPSVKKSQKTDLSKTHQDRIYQIWKKEFELFGYER